MQSRIANRKIVMTENKTPITSLEEVRAPHNVVAAVDSLDAARSLIETLENEGVDPEAISLLGAYPAEPGDEVAPASDDQPGGRTARALASGAAVGAGAGAASAAAIGAAVGIPGIGPVVAAGIWAVIGATAGATYNVPASVGISSAWHHTFEAVRDGNFVVGVHSEAEATVTKAEELMASAETLSVNRFDDENDQS